MENEQKKKYLSVRQSVLILNDSDEYILLKECASFTEARQVADKLNEDGNRFIKENN